MICFIATVLNVQFFTKKKDFFFIQEHTEILCPIYIFPPSEHRYKIPLPLLNQENAIFQEKTIDFHLCWMTFKNLCPLGLPHICGGSQHERIGNEMKTKGEKWGRMTGSLKCAESISDSPEEAAIVKWSHGRTRGEWAPARPCFAPKKLVITSWRCDPCESLAALWLNRVHRKCWSPKWDFSPIPCAAWESWQDEQGAISPHQGGGGTPWGWKIVSNQAQLLQGRALAFCLVVKWP